MVPANLSAANCEDRNIAMDQNEFRFDYSEFPKSLELSLPHELYELLCRQAAASGRSIDELILEILNRFIDPQQGEVPDVQSTDPEL